MWIWMPALVVLSLQANFAFADFDFAREPSPSCTASWCHIRKIAGMDGHLCVLTDTGEAECFLRESMSQNDLAYYRWDASTHYRAEIESFARGFQNVRNLALEGVRICANSDNEVRCTEYGKSQRFTFNGLVSNLGLTGFRDDVKGYGGCVTVDGTVNCWDGAERWVPKARNVEKLVLDRKLPTGCLIQNGQVKCWSPIKSLNENYRPGDPRQNFVDRDPVDLFGVKGIFPIAYTFCAKTDPRFRCWGTHEPLASSDDPGIQKLSDLSDIFWRSRSYQLCGFNSLGKVECSGSIPIGEQKALDELNAIYTIRQVQFLRYEICALTEEEGIVCENSSVPSYGRSDRVLYPIPAKFGK